MVRTVRDFAGFFFSFSYAVQSNTSFNILFVIELPYIKHLKHDSYAQITKQNKMITKSISIFYVLLVKNKRGTDGSVLWLYALTSSGSWPPVTAAKALVTILSTMSCVVSTVCVPT